MKNKNLVGILALALLLVTSLLPPATVAGADEPAVQTGEMEYGGYDRTYEYCIPSGYDGSEAVPLLFSFHGLGSRGVEQIDLTNFPALTEQEGFIAVFPDSTELEGERRWYTAESDVDDVGFVSELIEWFKEGYNIDETRIYATGMSNGSMFTWYVALSLPGTFAGIAGVTGPMRRNAFEFEDVKPMTVIVIHGTDDPIVPYEGSEWTSSVDETINFWIEVNETFTEPEVTVWDPTEEDSTRVVRYVYGGGKGGADVILYKVEGGGHLWPSGPQYYPPSVIGYNTYHIDASEKIWEHLKDHRLLYDLTVDSTDGGSVTTPGEGIFFHNSGTEVSLVAEPDEGYRFDSWTGDVDTIADVEDAETTITIGGNYEITASFEEAGGWCFIATAAYGTPMVEEIQILREFRDEYLLTNPLGKALVNIYYRVSPPIAEFITEHPVLKPLVRVGLLPSVAMSTVVINTNTAERIAIIGLLALVSVVLAVWATRRRCRGLDYTRE